MYNIAIGGISTECSSYSPLEQKKEDFIRIKGKKLIQYLQFNFKKKNKIKIHPIFFENLIQVEVLLKNQIHIELFYCNNIFDNKLKHTG